MTEFRSFRRCDEMNTTTLDLSQINFFLRPVQGYRYLDRCGEMMVKLEDTLDSGWIPKEMAPQGAVMINHDLGMTLRIDTTSLAMAQDQFFDFPNFSDQLCKVYDIVHRSFLITRLNAPSLQVIWQKGFNSPDEAEEYITRMNLFTPRSEAIQAMGGVQKALQMVLCTEEDTDWRECQVTRRVRLEVKSLKQLRQPPFDERLLQRTRLLPVNQQEAMKALIRLRGQQPEIFPFAAQFTIELAFETEFSTKQFDLPFFLSDAWQWHEDVLKKLTRISEWDKSK